MAFEIVRHNGNLAEEGAREIREISDKGTVTPSAVLDAARNPQSALHNLFNWDDVEAAESYRMLQATALIRSYRVYVSRQTSAPMSVKVAIARPSYERNPNDDAAITIRDTVAKCETCRQILNFGVDGIGRTTESCWCGVRWAGAAASRSQKAEHVEEAERKRVESVRELLKAIRERAGDLVELENVFREIDMM